MNPTPNATITPPHAPPSNWRPLVLLGAILLLELAIYLPVLRNDFALIDDYIMLSEASKYGLCFEGLFRPFNGHVIPLFRLFLLLQFKLFGTNPAGYYAVGLLLHLAVTALSAVFLLRVSGSWGIALGTAIVFGLSSAHWQPVLQVLASTSSLGTLCFLSSSLCFVQSVHRSDWRWFAAALLFHACAFFSLSFGIEIPLLFLALSLILERQLTSRERWSRGTLLAAVLAVNVGLLLGIRAWALSRFPEIAVSRPPGIRESLEFLPGSLKLLLGGMHEGFLKSFSGARFLNPGGGLPPPGGGSMDQGSRGMLQDAYVAGFFLLLLIAIDWKSKAFRDRAPLIGCCVLWMTVIYYLPVLVRGKSFFGDNYEAFIMNNRYRYLPGVFAAGTFALTISVLRLPRRGRSMIWARRTVALILVFTLLSNAADIRRKISALSWKATIFSGPRDMLVREVRARLDSDPGELILLNDSFFRSQAHKMTVRPEMLLPLYLPREMAERIRFISRDSMKTASGASQIYGAHRDGHLYPVAR